MNWSACGRNITPPPVNTTLVAAEYLEVVATRDGSTQDASGPKLIKKQEAHMSRRAELLADRIEQGAAGLAAFAERNL